MSQKKKKEKKKPNLDEHFKRRFCVLKTKVHGMNQKKRKKESTQGLSLVVIVLALHSVHPEFKSSQRLDVGKEPSPRPKPKKKNKKRKSTW